MIIFLFALLTVASGRVYPRSGINEDVQGLMYEIPEYEDPELVLFKLAARGAMPVFKVMKEAKDSEDSVKEKDTTQYLKIADVKKEIDEIISGLQTAKTKGKHNLLAEIIDAMQYLMKLKHHLFSIDISKLDDADETSRVLDISNKYSSVPKTSKKSSVVSDTSDESSLVSDTSDKSFDSDVSGKSSLVSDTSNNSSSVSGTSDEGSLVSDTSDKSTLVSDTSDKSSLVFETVGESPLVSDTSKGLTVTTGPPVQYSDVSAKHSADHVISYENLKDSDISRDKYLSPYSLIRHISISDSPTEQILTSGYPAKKDSASDIPAIMSFIPDIYKGRYGSAERDSDSCDEEEKKEIDDDEFKLVKSTAEPQVTTASSDAVNTGFEKKVKTLVDDNMYISESNQGEHGATIMSKKLTWKLRGLVEKPKE